MKKITKTSCLFFLLISLLWTGCKKENEFSDFVEGYIVASFRCGEINPESGQGTGELTTRGFLILLENRTDSMYTFNFPESLFNFPQEILEADHNSSNCGPIFFPDDREYKISFKYRGCELSEKIEFACGCFAMAQPFNWEAYKQVYIDETTKINP